jgi:hypothetical protein
VRTNVCESSWAFIHTHSHTHTHTHSHARAEAGLDNKPCESPIDGDDWVDVSHTSANVFQDEQCKRIHDDCERVRALISSKKVCACVCERERRRVCACVCVRESACVYVCALMCRICLCTHVYIHKHTCVRI